MFNFSFNDAYRIIKNVVDERINTLVKSGAGVEVTWGVVASAGAYECSVYVNGQGEQSYGFRIENGIKPNVLDPVRVSIDKRGNRWIDAILSDSSLAHAKLEIDPRDGEIRIGDGTVAPTPIPLAGHTHTHDHDADYADIAHTHPLAQGTSFPGSPATNDRFYRTDRRLEYFYDGTQWLTTTVFDMRIVSQSALWGGSSTIGRVSGPAALATAIVLERVACVAYVATTNNASNRWTIDFEKFDGNTLTVLSSVSTASSAPDTYLPYQFSLVGITNQAVTIEEFQASVIKVGTPGGIILPDVVVEYRKVG